METHQTLLVLLEPGARLPSAFDAERRARPEHVVVIGGGTLRVDEFAFRAFERITRLRTTGRPAERVVLVVRHGHPHPSRVLLGRAVVEHLAAVGGELVLAADGGGPALRHELLELAGELLAMAGARRLTIHVLFDQTPAPGVSRRPASARPEQAA